MTLYQLLGKTSHLPKNMCGTIAYTHKHTHKWAQCMCGPAGGSNLHFFVKMFTFLNCLIGLIMLVGCEFIIIRRSSSPNVINLSIFGPRRAIFWLNFDWH